MAASGNKATGEAASQELVDTRITVALIPGAAQDLQQLQERTNLSKTDIINRAITLYKFIDSQLQADRDLLVRDNNTGAMQKIGIR